MIIKTLLKEGYCFAVVQYYSYLTEAKIFTNQEWEILALRKDKKELSKYSFHLNNQANIPEMHRNPNRIISRVLEWDEIREFKSLKEHFTEIMRSEDGVVWEVKGQSLKEKLKKSKI